MTFNCGIESTSIASVVLDIVIHNIYTLRFA